MIIIWTSISLGRKPSNGGIPAKEKKFIIKLNFDSLEVLEEFILLMCRILLFSRFFIIKMDRRV